MTNQKAHLMSFHVLHNYTVQCVDRMYGLWWGWFGLNPANVYEFPVQHFNTQPVPESDWHLLQQLVSVGFKFYILLDLTNISKIFSKWSTDISLSPSLVQTQTYELNGWLTYNIYISSCTSIIQLMECLKTYWEVERMADTSSVQNDKTESQKAVIKGEICQVKS